MQSSRQLASSALLRELPWLSGAILNDAPLQESCSSAEWIKDFAEAVAYNEKHVFPLDSHTHIRKEFRIGKQPTFLLASLDEQAGIFSDSKQTFILAKTLLNYRLIDIAMWLTSDSPLEGSVAGIRRGRLPVKWLTTLDRQSNFRNWPGVVKNGIHFLRDYEAQASQVPRVIPATDTATAFYVSAVQRTHLINHSKILRNIEVAAFHLAFLLKGNFDLPLTFEELCGSLNISQAAMFERASDEMRNMRGLRLPLQVALGLSPTLLFLNVSLSQREVDRGLLLKSWACLGGKKPPALQRIERKIWTFLFDISSGKSEFHGALFVLLNDLGSVDLESVQANDALWLSDTYLDPDPIVDPGSNDVHQATEQQSEANFSGREASGADPMRDPTPNSATNNINHDNAFRGQGDPVDDHHQPSGQGTHAAENGMPEAENEHEETEVESTQAQEGSTAHDIIRRSARRAASSPLVMVAASQSGLKKGSIRKRKREKMEAIDPVASSVRTEVIDLSQDLNSDEKPESSALNLEIQPKIKGKNVTLHGPTETKCIQPEFHFEQDHRFFNEVLDAYQKFDVDGMPLFLANPSKSIISSMTEAEFCLKTTAEIQEIFSKQHILVYGSSATTASMFDRDTLLEIMREDQRISISDMSIPVTDDLAGRLRFGTMDDLLKNAPSGNALNALDLPLEDGITVPLSLSSDLKAWKRTIDLKLCKRTDRFPTTAMRWALVSTNGTYSVWHIDCDGLATVIEVKTGSKLWVLSRPKPGMDMREYIGNISTFVEEFSTQEANPQKWDCEAVLLTPGTKLYMRPCTPHCVFTLEPTISYGGHFYATSTIRETCIGLYHTFIAPRITTNTDHERESRELLRRMVTYYHSIYTSPKQPSSTNGHIISIETVDGLIDLLTLCNLMDMANVVYSKTYTEQGISSREHYDFIESRRLCRDILSWLSKRYVLEISGSNRLWTIQEMQRLYFQRQMRALVEYKSLALENDYSSYTEGCTLTAFLQEAALVLDVDIEDPFEKGSSQRPSLLWPANVILTLCPNPDISDTPSVPNAYADGLTLTDRLCEAKWAGDLALCATLQRSIQDRLGNSEFAARLSSDDRPHKKLHR